MKARAQENPGRQRGTCVDLSTFLSDLSDRGIPKASRIVANVLTPSGDLSAGIERGQLFHLVGIDVDRNIERSKTYHFSLVLLRDRGIAEATPVSSSTSSKTLQCWRAGFSADNYCIATFDIEIEPRLCDRKKIGQPARSEHSRSICTTLSAGKKRNWTELAPMQ
jgi:hypothetical protein